MIDAIDVILFAWLGNAFILILLIFSERETNKWNAIPFGLTWPIWFPMFMAAMAFNNIYQRWSQK